MNIKCIAVDDEPLALEKISSFIQKMPHLELMASFRSSPEALDFIQNNPVQLIFLDIQMDKMNGIELIGKMISRPQIILTTAFSEYAITGFDLAVTDFLLKPYTFERFSLAVNKVSEYISWQQADPAARQNQVDYIFIKSGYRLVKVFVRDILYIEGMRDYQLIVTGGGKIIVSHSISELEKLLPGSLIRCHKSYLVSLAAINSIERDRIKIGAKYIPIGDSYKEAFYKNL